MMISLLLYDYCTGIYSSRKIGEATYYSVSFRIVTGCGHPDRDMICSFRNLTREHLDKFFRKSSICVVKQVW